MESQVLKLKGRLKGRRCAALLLLVLASGLFAPATLYAHGAEFVYARLDRTPGSDTMTLRATVECLDNPLVEGRAAARGCLQELFKLVAAPEDAMHSARNDAYLPLGEARWSEQPEWQDPTVPVPVLDAPESSTAQHLWLTASWTFPLPSQGRAMLRVNDSTKLAVVLWEPPTGPSAATQSTRWQILLSGDRSFAIHGRARPESSEAQGMAAKPPEDPMGAAVAVVGFGSLLVGCCVVFVRRFNRDKRQQTALPATSHPTT